MKLHDGENIRVEATPYHSTVIFGLVEHVHTAEGLASGAGGDFEEIIVIGRQGGGRHIHDRLMHGCWLYRERFCKGGPEVLRIPIESLERNAELIVESISDGR